MNLNQVTIIGSGMVGCCWAIIFARAKYNVCMFDTDPSKKLDAVLKTVEAKLETLKKHNLLEESIADILGRIVGSANLADAVAASFYVQECIPEELALKKDIFGKLDAFALPEAMLASSTSNIPASQFTEDLHCRNRCLIVHPINPPHIIPLVEIIPSPWTTAGVTETVRNLMIKVGQKPVTLKKELPGFIVNRLQYALLGECYRLVQDGYISPEDIDTTITEGLAMRWSFMGPFQTIDLNAPKGVEDYCNRYNDGISKILKDEDNNAPFKPELAQILTQHQRSVYDVEKIPDAIEWRDQKLLSLARHKIEDQKTIDKLFPGKK
jgi:3-hydroxyacyl-CoA dehydrogenase